MLKKSIFGVDHISHGRTRPSRKLSDPAGRDSGFSAYVHRNQFAGPLSSANGTRPPKPQLSPMLNFRLFQHNPPFKDVRGDRRRSSPIGKTRPKAAIRDWSALALLCIVCEGHDDRDPQDRCATMVHKIVRC
jgi:hypothetical protein